MKTKFFFLAGFILLLTSCVKTEHKIRFKNLYSETINDVKIGPDDFGTVSSGVITNYQSIPEGNGAITGNNGSNGQLSGVYAIRGKGKHLWTATLSASGDLSIAEDK